MGCTDVYSVCINWKISRKYLKYLKIRPINYSRLFIPIQSDMNIKKWCEILLNTYNLDFLCLFPPFLWITNTLKTFFSTPNPNAVKKHMEIELHHWALVGPFQSIPCAWYHCSPLLSHPKPLDSRIIVDYLILRVILNDDTDRKLFYGYQFESSKHRRHRQGHK